MGGNEALKFRISATRVEGMPVLCSGMAFHILPRTYMIACDTSRSVRSVARLLTSPASSSLSPNKSSSSSSSWFSGFEADLWTGFRRGRAEKEEELDELRLKDGGLLDFFIRLEWAAENLKLIVRYQYPLKSCR